MENLAFISYSRNSESDQEIVHLAAHLLRAGGAKVFLDVTDIEYGDRWEEVLNSNLSQCERILVFWSVEASSSDWVDREWRLALKLEKVIIPVFLDDTPLPTELAKFQGLPGFRSLLFKALAAQQPPKPQEEQMQQLQQQQQKQQMKNFNTMGISQTLVKLLFMDTVQTNKDTE